MSLLFDFYEIGNRLLAIRKKAGLTQSEIAERAGLSDRTYAEMERGNVNIRMETLLKICGVLNITPDEILTSQDDDALPDENELIERIKKCPRKNKTVALKLMKVYLDSLGEGQ